MNNNDDIYRNYANLRDMLLQLVREREGRGEREGGRGEKQRETEGKGGRKERKRGGRRKGKGKERGGGES